MVQCDVYSCAEFSSNEVLSEFLGMEVVNIDHMLLNRADEIKTISSTKTDKEELERKDIIRRGYISSYE